SRTGPVQHRPLRETDHSGVSGGWTASVDRDRRATAGPRRGDGRAGPPGSTAWPGLFASTARARRRAAGRWVDGADGGGRMSVARPAPDLSGGSLDGHLSIVPEADLPDRSAVLRVEVDVLEHAVDLGQRRADRVSEGDARGGERGT